MQTDSYGAIHQCDRQVDRRDRPQDAKQAKRLPARLRFGNAQQGQGQERGGNNGNGADISTEAEAPGEMRRPFA